MSRPEKQNPPQLHYNERVRACRVMGWCWIDDGCDADSGGVGHGLVGRPCIHWRRVGGMWPRSRRRAPRPYALVVAVRIHSRAGVSFTSIHPPQHYHTGGAQVPQQLARRGRAGGDHRAGAGAAGARGTWMHDWMDRLIDCVCVLGYCPPSLPMPNSDPHH